MVTTAEGVRLYTAAEIARFFLYLVDQDEDAGEQISNLKLQKLVYYAQGFGLAIFGEPLFGEPIEAWLHGPAVPTLYQAYKGYGRQAIPVPDDFDVACYEPPVRTLIYEVYRNYGQYSAWALRELTHEEPPYRQTPPGEVIELGLLRDYFRTQVGDDAGRA